ncbi:hypothetical protein BHE74_00022693 [Ensete ventricosum]|nr:hypothetical protein BHE74_00022693 [Ensete ventricosum]
MAKHHGESSKMGQAGPLPQVAASGLQVQTRSQTAGAAHEEHDSEHDEREVGYSPRAEEAQSGAPTGKRSHKERLSTMETRLDVLEASLEELYQGQGRLLGVESSQEEDESRIDRVESLVDRLMEDTKDSVRHLHEVVAELTAKRSIVANQARWGKPDLRPKQSQVGCKCKLVLKLLEPLMSVAANTRSEKLGILCERRRCNLEPQSR